MRNFYLIIILSIISISASAQIDGKEFNCCRHLNHQKVLKGTQSNTGNNYDITYHRLELEVDPAVHYINGAITTHLFAIEDNVSEITFDFSDSLFVDSVIYHQSLMTFNSSNEILTISLSEQIGIGQLDSVTVYYQGAPPQNGFGSFVADEHEGVPVLWTLSEPFGAKDWWPCKQNLNDKINSIDVIIKTPDLYKVASNGLLISEIANTGNKTTHWRHSHPIAAYLIAIAVTNYVEYSEYVPFGENDSIHVLNYVFPESLEEAEVKTKNVIEIMTLFNEYYGLYPYRNEKYGHAEFGWGGGMEHQTMSFMGGFGHELIAHELAHQWFGDYITCGSWHDIWLNEGFATYLQGWTYEHMFDGYYWTPWLNGTMNNVLSEPDGSVYVEDTTDVSRIFSGRLTYAKGAMLLHMLRWELGDTSFFAGMQNYLTDENLINNYARVSDYINQMEIAGDTSLTEFFNDWFYGEGYPMYSINWGQNEDGIVSILMDQEQSHESVDYFEMHVPIKFNGETSDTIITFSNTSGGQEYHFPLDFEVLNIEFDPNRKIVSDNNIIHNIYEITVDEELIISPNPAYDIVTITLKKGITIEKVNIIDMNGKVVKTVIIDSFKKDVIMNTKDLCKGTYFIELQSPKEIFKGKMIKQ